MNTTQTQELSEIDVSQLQNLNVVYNEVREELSKKIIGQQQIIKDLFIGLIAQGHCLMIGVPGLAKTLIVKSLAEILDLQFQRIQFTPDLMPSDITGSEILEESGDGKRSFRFVPGPIFTQLLLADEINRTPPKTQAALLEAMQEHKVTISGQTHSLRSPFFVLATQNPIEQEGTYPLPEAQLDRFMFNLSVGYPTEEEEIDILLRTTVEQPAPLRKLIGAEDIQQYQKIVRHIPVPDSVAAFIVKLVQSTRPKGDTAPDFVKHYIEWGAGPRASQYLALAGKVLAVLDGRFNVAREDIIAASKLVLRHRLVTNYRADADRMTVDQVIDNLITKLR